MAPIVDSTYTDPDALRALYVNPRNALKYLNDLAAQAASSTPTVPVLPQPGTIVNIDPNTPIGCPLTGEWVIALKRGTISEPIAMLIDDLTIKDKLYQPVLQEFRQVVAIEHIPYVLGVSVHTQNGAVSRVSITDKIIQHQEDTVGMSIDRFLKKGAETVWDDGVLSLMPQNGGWELVQSHIAYIITLDRRQTAIKISLEGENGDIYASGRGADKGMTVRHNAKIPDPDIPPEI